MHDIKPVGTLGLTVVADAAETVAVAIPLSENHNDKGTLFAGSTFSGAVFAGYRLAQRILAPRGEDTLVCRDASIRYLRPVGTDATARARCAGPVMRKPGGNLHLPVTVTVAGAGGETGAEARFVYVLVPAEPAPDARKEEVAP